MKKMMRMLAAKMKVMNRGTKKVYMGVLACLLLTALAVGSISAYFTDGDAVTNTFTVGRISLDLQEPDWDPDTAKDMTPNQTVKKNPQIYNDGANSEFVFMEVVIPYGTLITANEDGTLNAAGYTELYHYTVNPGWHQMSGTRNEADQTVTYLYVYGDAENCTELAVGSTTPALFDTVTLANVVEDQALEGKTLEIIIKAYGIQTTNINGGKTAPADVWMVLSNQAPSVVKE
ncbi:MAG: Camelysin metallo-endopeptidase [Lachnospiraceae bacterium]|nr:Camelysin metallo-endopeptidase [Lachnospiraceae bacterium]